ncbi:MAG: hypothetical protein HY314_04800 [Acidobacteria bacterium]|nr:hypothetical protein [Acidobacteriota bacterium]
MTPCKILIPVCDDQNACRIVRRLSWLVPERPAELFLVEMNLPLGFLQWLFGLIIDRKARRRDHLAEAQRLALWREQLPCETAEMLAPNPVIGIAEAALRVKPDIIILAPELLEHMTLADLDDLVRRLSEICRCILLVVGYGFSWEIERSSSHEPFDLGDIVR